MKYESGVHGGQHILIRVKGTGVSLSKPKLCKRLGSRWEYSKQPFAEVQCLNYLRHMPKPVSLTKRELDIMSVLWRRKSATVGEIKGATPVRFSGENP